MALNLKVQVVTARFSAMLQEFARIAPELEFRDIVRAAAIRVIAGALRRTRAADAANIRRRWANAKYTTMDGKLYNLSFYYHNDALWNRIVQKRQRSLQTKLNSRGLAKRSWLFEAEKLGAAELVDAPDYVTRANYKGVEYPLDAEYVERGSAMGYTLKIINSSPIVQAAGGEAALLGSMQAEARYFEVLLAKGFLSTAEQRAAKYPGVYVLSLAPSS